MLLLLAAASCGVLGCGGSKRSQPDALAAANRMLPLWQGEMRTMFDDQITPAAFGMSMDGRSPAADPWLKLRAQAAEVVARMRVQTVTRDTVGTQSRYLLTLQVGAPTLMPPRINNPTFELTISPNSTSFGMVQSMESTLRGKIFVGFVRRFQGVEEPEVHFHLTADTPEVAKVIQEAALLDELSKQ